MHKTRKTKTLNCWNTKFNTGYQLGFCVNDVSKVCVKVGICVIIIFLVKNTFAERWPRQITKWAQSLLFKITYQAFLKIRNNHVSISCHMVYIHVIYVTWKLTNYKKLFIQIRRFTLLDLKFSANKVKPISFPSFERKIHNLILKYKQWKFWRILRLDQERWFWVIKWYLNHQDDLRDFHKNVFIR